MNRPFSHHSKRGVALVMSLFFISLITILAVGFLTSMRSERFSADAHLQGIRAQHLAQAGVDVAAARIAQATQTNSFWISQPGRITRATLSGASITPTDLKNVELHSGALQTGDSTDLAVDLNLPNLFSTSRNFITAQNVNLKVRWIYLRQDGTLVMPGATVPAYNKSNPLVGRFAFWADDEGAKINLNTAWRRSVTVPRWDPSQLNLLIFSGINSSLADTLKSTRTGKHYFHSLDETRAVNTTFSGLIDSNRFDLTILNRAPELNLFGDPRIMLTLRSSIAGSQPYLNILLNEASDSGTLSNIDSSKLQVVTASLTSLLTRTDWPMNPGHSLAEKFSPVRPEQIALNIIEYVRARESDKDVVEPIRGEVISGGKVAISTSNANTAILGNNRGPRITEIGVWIAPAMTTQSGIGGFDATYVTELYLPTDYGIDQIDLTQYQLIRLYGLGVGGAPVAGLPAAPPGRPNASPDPSSLIVVTDLDGGTDKMLKAGQCRTVARNFRINVSTRPTDLCLRVALSKTSGARLDVVTLGSYPGNVGINYKIGNSPTWNGINSMEVSDPCVNKTSNDWIARAANTFLAVPAKGNITPGLNAQQDTDMSGALTSSSLRFPPRSGLSGNVNGVVESVAELGFVHTGVECSTNGVPFRTVRLQPQKNLQVPDWALLDLFCTPYKTSTTSTSVPYYLRDADTGRGGLINLNAFRKNALVPFLDASGTSLAQRKNGFLAAVTDAYKDNTATQQINSAQADTLQASVSEFTKSSGSNAGRDYGFDKLFLSRGELAEMSSVSDTGEESEALMRGVIDLMEVRSNAYTVHAVGQAIIQASNQNVIVQAEQRMEALLIRDKTGKVRQFFSRNLRP